jgi:hypothetical protein
MLSKETKKLLVEGGGGQIRILVKVWHLKISPYPINEKSLCLLVNICENFWAYISSQHIFEQIFGKETTKLLVDWGGANIGFEQGDKETSC